MRHARWRFAALTALAMLLWAALVLAAPLVGIGGISPEGRGAKAFLAAARPALLAHEGNLALVLIEKGRVVAVHTQSIGKPVSAKTTLFQMASVSKWVTAWGVMALVEEGRLDLDVPVERYLTRWHLPPGDYPDDQVTVRRLLSHTAGLTDDLGYCGFVPGEPVQTLEASLTKAADACPLRTGTVRVGDQAGNWRYSGGGVTLLQLLIEEVTRESFADYMERRVLRPLGMTHSTFRFDVAEKSDLAEFFDASGKPAPHKRYTALAAASLYASADDMARFAMANLPGPEGEAPGRGVISSASVLAMRKPQASLFGTPHWGLGHALYARSSAGDFIIGHEGHNVPAINNSVRVETATGDAIVALSTGGTSVATLLGSEWTRARRASITPAMAYGAVTRLLDPFAAIAAWAWLIGGWIIILMVSFFWRRRIRRTLHPAV